MRVLSIVICVLCVAIPEAMARPKPKIAVAPLIGDSGNKVADAIVDALAGKDFAVVGPKDVHREMTRLGLPDELDTKAARKLASKLGVVAVIDGKVSKAGGKRSLHLDVHRRGKPDAGFTVEFKTTTSKGFRRGIHDEISKKLEGADDAAPADDDDDSKPATLASDDAPRRKPADDDADRKRTLADDDTARRRTASDADDRKRKVADDDAASRPRKSADGGKKPRKVAAGDDDAAETTVRKRRNRTRDDAAAPRLAARVGAGVSVAQRQLSWDLRSGFAQAPPRVGTAAGGGRVDGEIYPFALADPGSRLASLGLAAAYDRTFGLAIKVPNQPVNASIDQSHYAIGARYRFGVGEASTIAVGLDYARRKYAVEHSSLMGATLDMPDVNYAALSPVASVRVPITASIAAFGGAGGLLIFDAGAIQRSTSYGPAKVYGLEGAAGVDIAITQQIGVRVALEYSQIMFSFTPSGDSLANNRDGNPGTLDVNGATDRSMGIAATLGLAY